MGLPLSKFLLYASAAAQPPSQQATRHARRVYVGGLPPTGNEQNIATFFSNALAAVGGTTAGPGEPLKPCPCSRRLSHGDLQHVHLHIHIDGLIDDVSIYCILSIATTSAGR